MASVSTGDPLPASAAAVAAPTPPPPPTPTPTPPEAASYICRGNTRYLQSAAKKDRPSQHLLLRMICHPKGANTTPVVVRQGLSHATAAVLTPGSTTTRTKVSFAATLGQKASPVWANFTKF